MKFETKEEILDFVLSKSGGMSYRLMQSKNGRETLKIESNPDLLRIGYAISLLREIGDDIKSLALIDLDLTDDIFDNGALENVDGVDFLYLFGNKLTRMPRFNKDIRCVWIDNGLVVNDLLVDVNRLDDRHTRIGYIYDTEIRSYE